MLAWFRGGRAVDGYRRYDALTALACRYAAKAYADPAATDEDGGTLLSDPDTDAQAVVHFDLPRIEGGRRTAVVAFRGSSSPADWAHNAMVPLRSLPSPHRATVRAHTGFLRQYASLHARLVRALRDAEVDHVLLCGHSLGGALAVIAAAMLPEGATCDIVTFGAPRAGNSELCAAAFNRCLECVRVVHDRDVVPTIPLRAMGYSHVRRPWLRLDGQGIVRPMDREPGVLAQLVWRVRGALSLDFGVRDHFVDAYMRGVPNAPDSDDA